MKTLHAQRIFASAHGRDTLRSFAKQPQCPTANDTSLPPTRGDLRRAWAASLATLMVCLTSGGARALSSTLPEQEWVAQYSETNSAGSPMSPTAIAADSAGNVYLTGPATVKYDSAGRRAWTARPKDNDINLPVAVRVDSSGNVYVAGPSNWSGNPSDFVTAKYDAQGNESWLRHYHSHGSLADRVVAMAIDETGNVYVTGTSGDDTSASPAYNWLTLKYDSNGELLWTARYSGPFNKDGPTAIAVGNQSQVYVTGTSTGFGSSDDIVTVKYESNGSQAWVARYDNPDHIPDRAGSIALDAQAN